MSENRQMQIRAWNLPEVVETEHDQRLKSIWNVMVQDFIQLFPNDFLINKNHINQKEPFL